jgi:hypothetical protein
MNKIKMVSGLLAVLCIVTIAAASEEQGGNTPRIQLVILLDTSNSMDGLIAQAKTQLWKIVNEFVTVEKNGKRPLLEIALFEYGNTGLSKGDGWIRMVLPLTDDLDKVSEELFALTTNGGQEYCGWVITNAVEKLSWSRAPGDYKAIFIAGNEAFTQGPVNYAEACKAAINKGIVVNTIHCGSYDDGVSGKWQDGARLADGSYLHIDHNRTIVQIEAPQDKELAQLSRQLNETYVAYGAHGADGADNQRRQDANAKSASPSSEAERAVAKASTNYRNASWDLIDAVRDGTVKLDEIEADGLPKAMRTMTLDERKAHVEAMAALRQKIQERVQALGMERTRHVADEMAKRGETDEADTLDAAMQRAIEEQAQAKEFSLK